jgi:uncharacterized protein YecA (UPF0149 family)
MNCEFAKAITRKILHPFKINPSASRHKAREKAMKALDPDAVYVPLQPAQSLRRRVGRNERCPCGSRKKFKRCDGIKLDTVA